LDNEAFVAWSVIWAIAKAQSKRLRSALVMVGGQNLIEAAIFIKHLLLETITLIIMKSTYRLAY
jgi:hypothetical protein